MKKCPSCSRTYTDDTLSFCLDDGTPLQSTAIAQPPGFDPNATLQYNAIRETTPQPAAPFHVMGPPPSSPPFTPTPSWAPSPPSGAGRGYPQPKKSKAMFWIVGGIAALVVVGVGAVILIVALASLGSNTNNSNTAANTNSGNSSNRNSEGSSSKNYVIRDDFSSKQWWTGSTNVGKADYVNGEYQISAAAYENYMVVYAPQKTEYMTEDITARVTTRSVTGASPSLGYGIAAHGEMKNNNLEDYAFLIRTDESPAFRVAVHQSGNENNLVNWTRSSLIRTGSTPNQLEVRVKGDQLSFYINGQFATSITDSSGYKRGYVGLYTSDTAPVAFDDLELYK
jgi:hypothetical protein